jgi:hypothetical protein
MITETMRRNPSGRMTTPEDVANIIVALSLPVGALRQRIDDLRGRRRGSRGLMGMGSYGVLWGKTAVITGSGRGIGRAIALELAGHGVNVAVNYFRHAREAEATAADEVRSLGATRGRGEGSRRRDCTGVQRLVETAAEAFGGVDIFVGNAASGFSSRSSSRSRKGGSGPSTSTPAPSSSAPKAAAQYMMRKRLGPHHRHQQLRLAARPARVQRRRRQQGGDRGAHPLPGR